MKSDLLGRRVSLRNIPEHIRLEHPFSWEKYVYAKIVQVGSGYDRRVVRVEYDAWQFPNQMPCYASVPMRYLRAP